MNEEPFEIYISVTEVHTRHGGYSKGKGVVHEYKACVELWKRASSFHREMVRIRLFRDITRKQAVGWLRLANALEA